MKISMFFPFLKGKYRNSRKKNVSVLFHSLSSNFCGNIHNESTSFRSTLYAGNHHIVIGRCRGVCERKEKMIAKVSNNFKYQFLITGNELWMLELSSGLCIDDGFKPLICICKSCHYQSTEAFQYRLIHSINSINPLRNFNFNSAVRST